MKVSRAKAREHARQRKYFRDDIEQPLDRKTKRPNRRFEAIYGKEAIKKRQTGQSLNDLYEIDYE